jgi:hypothetical protein
VAIRREESRERRFRQAPLRRIGLLANGALRVEPMRFSVLKSMEDDCPKFFIDDHELAQADLMRLER